MTDLFNTDACKKLSPRMKLIKKHDIKTNYCKDLDAPWLAMPMNIARKVAKGYNKSYATMTEPVEVCASVGRLLDEQGVAIYGDSEKEVVDGAIQYAELNDRWVKENITNQLEPAKDQK